MMPFDPARIFQIWTHCSRSSTNTSIIVLRVQIYLLWRKTFLYLWKWFKMCKWKMTSMVLIEWIFKPFLYSFKIFLVRKQSFWKFFEEEKNVFHQNFWEEKTLNNGYPEYYGNYFKSGTSSIAVTGIKTHKLIFEILFDYATVTL